MLRTARPRTVAALAASVLLAGGLVAAGQRL